MCVTQETPQYTAFFVSFGSLLDFGQNYFTFANPNLQISYCNRHIIRRIKLYCYYLINRISNSLFGLWTFNLILITTSTNLQNKFSFIFLCKLNSEANPPVHFNVNITNKNTFRINHVAWPHCPSACLFIAVVPRV